MAFCLKIEATPEVGINLFSKQSQSMSWVTVKRMVPKGQRPHPLVYDGTIILWMAEPVSLVCIVYLQLN